MNSRNLLQEHFNQCLDRRANIAKVAFFYIMIVDCIPIVSKMVSPLQNASMGATISTLILDRCGFWSTVTDDVKKPRRARVSEGLQRYLTEKSRAITEAIVCTIDISAAVQFLSFLPTWSANDCWVNTIFGVVFGSSSRQSDTKNDNERS